MIRSVDQTELLKMYHILWSESANGENQRDFNLELTALSAHLRSLLDIGVIKAQSLG